jgi:hypothetical protein
MSDLRRVEDLTLRLLDEYINDDEREELNRLVSEGDEAARLHVHLIEQEAVLRGYNRDLDLTDATMEHLRRTQADRVSKSVMEEIRELKTPEEPARAAGPSPAGRLRVVVSAAAVVAVAVAAAAIGYHAATLRQKKQKPSETAAQKDTVARINKIESTLRDLQAELKKLAALEQRVLNQVRKTAAKEVHIAQAHAELSKLGRRQQKLVLTLKRGAPAAPAQVGRARSELEKLDALKKRLLQLARETTDAGKQEIMQMLAEIGRKARLLQTAIRVATAARARRILRMRRRKPRAAVRARRAAPPRAFMAASPYDGN